jgi:nicotinate phosphoribosyltransferase
MNALTPQRAGLITDLYELTMAAGYWQSGKYRDVATFELSVRSLPAHRSYLLAAGLEQAVEYLRELRFGPEEIAFLRKHPALQPVKPEFFDFLAGLRFTGTVWAAPEGTVVFAEEPLLRVTAPIIEAQIVETCLLAMLTYQTTVATKASRMTQVAQGKGIVEFGTRRAHGPHAGWLASRASFIGGCRGTSNVLAGFDLGIPTYGTLAHSWMMSYEEEEDAFRQFTQVYGDSSVLLVDTYDSVEGVRKALHGNLPFRGVRLDSGNFLETSREVRKILDAAGRADVQILASGDLNEYAIAELVRAGAPIDLFGVGTDLVTSRDAPALSGVYKLVEIESGGQKRATAKFSESKISYPGTKQIFRIAPAGEYERDVLGLASEEYAGAETLLEPVIENGEMVRPLPPLEQVQARAAENLARLPARYRQLEASDLYPVEKSQALRNLLESVRGRYLAAPVGGKAK